MRTQYVDLSLVVDGALEDEQELYTEDDLDAAIEEIKADAAKDPDLVFEVYIIRHTHSPHVAECSCYQHLTDHKPEYTFNKKDH